MLLTQCQREEAPEKATQDNQYEIALGKKVSADIAGVILKEDGTPLENASVKVGGKIVYSDSRGFFSVEKAYVNENHAYVKVSVDGYFPGSRSIIPQEGMNWVRIKMLSNTPVTSFDANTGGTAQLGSSKVVLPAGFTDIGGNSYNGKVNVALKYLDPESDELHDIMPGDLIAATAEGDRGLETFGMLAVELTNSSGSQILMKKGNEATLHVPLSATMLADAPTAIPLWYFDEVNGYWQEEGEAQLQGNEYVGKVKHFSFWNCDRPWKANIIRGKVQMKGGEPFAGASVSVSSQLRGAAKTTTCSSGKFGGRVPSEEALKLDIKLSKGIGSLVLKSLNIGPFSSDTELPVIELDNLQDWVRISGSVLDCDSTLLSKGKVVINDELVIELNGGNFSFYYPPSLPFTLRLYNGREGKYSALKQFPGYSTDTKVFEEVLCSTNGGGSSSGAVWSLNFTLDGVDFQYSNANLNSTSRLVTEDQIEIGCSSYKYPNPVDYKFGMILRQCNGPGSYTLPGADPEDGLWLGDRKKDHVTRAKSINLKVKEYINKKDFCIMDFEFSGTMEVWNDQLQVFEEKPLTNGIWKYTK